VPSRKQNTGLFELAKRGAEARLGDLVHEAKLLIKLFPHLRDSFDHDELPMPFIMARSSGGLGPRRAKRKMSAAARKAVSARMKRYWAKRRSAKK
jgi:hypothetical protein